LAMSLYPTKVGNNLLLCYSFSLLSGWLVLSVGNGDFSSAGSPLHIRTVISAGLFYC
jgi:hypothetical protein